MTGLGDAERRFGALGVGGMMATLGRSSVVARSPALTEWAGIHSPNGVGMVGLRRAAMA